MSSMTSPVPRKTTVSAMYTCHRETGRPSSRSIVRSTSAGTFSVGAALAAIVDPEELVQDEIDAELARAIVAGAHAPSAKAIAEAVDTDPLVVESDYELRLAAIDLVEQYSPQEEDLITGWRVPRVK